MTLDADVLYRAPGVVTSGVTDLVRALREQNVQTIVVNATQRDTIERDFGAGTFKPHQIQLSSETSGKLTPKETAFVGDKKTSVDWALARGYLSSQFDVHKQESLNSDFLLRELATREWRARAQALVARGSN